MKVHYTQITFATPLARVRYVEASLENRARDVARIYEGLRVDDLDDDLVYALHDLQDEIYELDKAREAEEASR